LAPLSSRALGFLVESREAQLPSGLIYRGIDRLPDVRSPDELRRSLRDVLADRYWEDLEDGSVQTSLVIASELAEKFSLLGQPMEVIHAEVSLIPTALARHDSMVEAVLTKRAYPQRPFGARFIGVDVALPIPSYFSAIRNSQVSEELLNAFGLLTDLEAALGIAEKLNSARDPALIPLCCVQICEIRPPNDATA
jgi:hypothetical protein